VVKSLLKGTRAERRDIICTTRKSLRSNIPTTKTEAAGTHRGEVVNNDENNEHACTGCTVWDL